MEIRPTTDEDLEVFVDTVHTAFGRFPETPVTDGGRWWSALEMERALFAVAPDGRPVGTAAAYSFELTLPGRIPVPVAGVTAVGVVPSHRRQGVLSAMMRHQLTEVRTRGEFLSVLLASEAPIYGRFGYGPATSTARLTVPRDRAGFAVARGRGAGAGVGAGAGTGAGAGAGTGAGAATGIGDGTGIGSGAGSGTGIGSGAGSGTDIGSGAGSGTDIGSGAGSGTDIGSGAGSGTEIGPGDGSVEVLKRADCGEILEAVYDRYRRAQPGALSRPPRWWALGAGQPPVSPAPRYVAVHRDADGVPDGYASYSLGEENTLTVDETVATDDAVFTALARCVLGHDLVSRIVFRHVPPEHPLRWQLADVRAGEVGGQTDWLWVRLLDVPLALTARGWFADGEIVLDVDDPFLGERARHLLTVRDGKADCVPTDRDPDLSLDVRDLGSVYLGGTRPSTLVRAGHITAHHPGAAALADTLFGAEEPPHCLHWF